MTDITHHPDAELLLGHAAGTLPAAYDLVVATHLTLCDRCRAEVMALEEVGGRMLEGADPAPVAPGGAAAALDRARAMPPLPPHRGRSSRAAPLPDPVAGFAMGFADGIRWRPLGAGVKQVTIDTGPGPTARLLSIPAGRAMPDHSHGGLEVTMVLTGAYRDEGGRFARGDVQVADETTHHTPVAEPGETCICLAVTDARLRFRGLLPRIVQPFVGI